jgi:anthranilate synthase component 2
MTIALIDNYDSFTYNLLHYLEDLGAEVTVFRNDEVHPDELESYDRIVLSPGPGLPKDAGVMPAVIKRYAGSKSILGICLGQQAIAEAYGGTLINLPKVYHGVATKIILQANDEHLFKGLLDEFEVGRYHSWSVSREQLPDDLIITSVDEQGEIMSLKHRTHDVRGVQFHPESILTEHGKQMLANWLNA